MPHPNIPLPEAANTTLVYDTWPTSRGVRRDDGSLSRGSVRRVPGSLACRGMEARRLPNHFFIKPDKSHPLRRRIEAGPSRHCGIEPRFQSAIFCTQSGQARGMPDLRQRGWAAFTMRVLRRRSPCPSVFLRRLCRRVRARIDRATVLLQTERSKVVRKDLIASPQGI
jgi:hypothetical protein